MSEHVIGANARRPNPALQPLAFLIGDWSTSGTHPAFPGEALPGTTSFAWAEGGAFLLMRSQTDHKDFPDGIAIFGSDDVLGTITLCWFDQRGISRLCPVTAGERSVQWRHDDPAFMQRLTITADADGHRMSSKGEMAKDGADWGDDLSQIFIRKPDAALPDIFYHGTRADLRTGDMILAGYDSNYGAREQAGWVYLTGTLDAAIWGAELAQGEGQERIYIVEPTGPIIDDPNLTDKKFPGNPTRSYRSRDPLRVIGEVTEWEGHPPERLREMKDNLARLKARGVEAID